jgi:hypothetical protein
LTLALALACISQAEAACFVLLGRKGVHLLIRRQVKGHHHGCGVEVIIKVVFLEQSKCDATVGVSECAKNNNERRGIHDISVV